MKVSYKLNDETIAAIAKCLQVAMLTGTDISDNLRMLSLEKKSKGVIGVTSTYKKIFDNNVDKMVEEVAHLAPVQQTKDDIIIH